MSRFKTELCNNLIELGTCKYGDRCHYAHGHHELRQVSRRHPKYRTEKCKNFELTGKCPFGPRCSYVHPKPDLDSMIEQLSKYMKHTKAPKPDSEDDEDHDVSFFTTRIRTSPSISLSLSPSPSPQPPATNCAAAATAATAAVAAAATVSVNNHNNTSIVRTPLGSNNSSNILSSMNFSNLTVHNNHLQSTTTPILNVNDQINGSTTSKLLNTSNFSTGSMGIYSHNFSFNESTQTFESNKKPRLVQTSSSTNGKNSASNPFGIRNPLSDYINTTNINGKSPLQPNKQFYTRF